MAKITKRQLSRGVKLTSDLAFEPHVAIESQIEAGTIEEENLKADESVFRVNLSIPQINSNAFYSQKVKTDPGGLVGPYDDSYLISCVAIPFTLPPPQEFVDYDSATFMATSKTDENTPYYTLDEVSFSFDQRAEGMGIADRFSTLSYMSADHWDTTQGAGFNDRKLVEDGADNYKIKISILEKDQTWFPYPKDAAPSLGWTAVDVELLRPATEIVSIEVPAIAFKSKHLRLNPFAVDQLNKQLKPWKTYVVVISAPDLCGGDKESFFDVDQPPPAAPIAELYSIPKLFGLMSFNLSLKLRCELMEQDSAPDPIPANAVPVQNIPTDHLGRTTAPIVSTNYPIPGQPISAEDIRGLQTNTNILDDIIKNKLDGGYTKESDLQGARALKDTAGYEMICVPMWTNFTDYGVMDPSTISAGSFATAFPNAGDALASVPYSDRRIIPLNYPMTIHHVVLGMSYINPVGVWRDQRSVMPLAGQLPSSPTFRQSVGVAIGSGHRGIETTYQQVAHVEFGTNNAETVAPKRELYTIDRVHLTPNQSMVYSGPSLAGEFWELELLRCPLVDATAGVVPGAGYAEQGTPFFVGKAMGGVTNAAGGGTNHGTINRSTVGAGDATDLPFTKGREQWLEIRWQMHDPSGLAGAGTPTQWQTYAGMGGMWVYIYGKKSITHWKDDLNLP